MAKKKKDALSFKKIIYVLLVILLGKMLGFIAYGMLSIKFLRILLRRGLPVEHHNILGIISSPLPTHLFWLFTVSGAVAGFFLGLRWWQIVYVEHRHWKSK